MILAALTAAFLIALGAFLVGFFDGSLGYTDIMIMAVACMVGLTYLKKDDS